ncbi:hypothetical protein [Silanimonas sp.]|uniref:hypothetical protein n=1 Tax=Silanimonas sp. TaxID=1929290 RepID=UPI0025DAB40C|nr:hypothetical protein [Silanimonas sp.]
MVHGRDDGLVPEAFSSTPYVAWARNEGASVAHWSVAHVQHFDAFRSAAHRSWPVGRRTRHLTQPLRARQPVREASRSGQSGPVPPAVESRCPLPPHPPPKPSASPRPSVPPAPSRAASPSGSPPRSPRSRPR